jgi:hypothetical protein
MIGKRVHPRSSAKIEAQPLIMKIIKTMLVSATLTVLGFTARAQVGLVAHYPLDGNANDVAGLLHGTVVGATPTTNRFGQASSAYSFNGTSSRIEFSSPPLNQGSNWTISAWVRVNTFSQEGIPVYVGFDNGTSSDGFGFGLNNSASLLGFSASTPQGYVPSGQSFTNTSQWHHVVILRSNNGPFTFYLNGVQSINNGPPPSFAPTDFTIGSQNGVRYFNGAIDDVRIYNRAISSNEVAQLFNDVEFCSPHTAVAVAILSNGFVVGANVTDPACGYTNAPMVSIVGGGGSNATAIATISDGRVTAINIASAGCCYTNVPKIIIDSPPFAPSLSIIFSKVNVVQRVGVGQNYVLEYTTNLVNWIPAGPQFTAQSEIITNDFDLALTGRYFRIREVP